MFNGISVAPTNGSTARDGEGDLVCSMRALNARGEETTMLISASRWLGLYAADIQQRGIRLRAEYFGDNYTFIEEEEEDDDDDDEDFSDDGDDEGLDYDDYEAQTRPASQAAIEGLEKVEIDESLGGACTCTVCLEEMAVGTTEARRLPCSHVYHAACIVEWLKKSNMCPLCRHKLPVVDFDLNVKMPDFDFDLNLDDVSC